MREMIPCLYGKNNQDDIEFLIKNHGEQREVAQHFSGAQNYKQNSVSNKTVLQEQSREKIFSDKGKLNEISLLEIGPERMA